MKLEELKRYQVIGGQYAFCRYGESDTLRGAKQIASHHAEYWDNWQGWHKPAIYLAEDCIIGEPTEFNYSGIYPADGAEPVSVFVNGRFCLDRGEWEDAKYYLIANGAHIRECDAFEEAKRVAEQKSVARGEAVEVYLSTACEFGVPSWGARPIATFGK